MRRELTSLVAAFAVHSVLITAASRLPARAPLASSSDIASAPIELVEIDLGASDTNTRVAPPLLMRAPDPATSPVAPRDEPEARIEPEPKPEPEQQPEPDARPDPETETSSETAPPFEPSATSNEEPTEPTAEPTAEPTPALTPAEEAEPPLPEEPIAASTELPPMSPVPAPAEPASAPAPIAEPIAPAAALPSPAPLPEAPPAAPSDTIPAPGEPEAGGLASSNEPGPGTRGAAENGWSPTEQGPTPPSVGLPGVPGLGSTPVWASVPGLFPSSAGVAAPTAAPKSRPVDPEAANRVLSSTMRSRDATLGLSVPAAQIVAGTVADATRTVPVPHNTRASFEVQLAPDGRVLSTKVLTASGGDASAWNAAAKSVAASLGGRTLVMGADGARSGATIVVSVTTKHVYPAGTSKRAEIKPVCANQIINDLADAASTKPGSPASDTAGPSLFTDENGRPCIPVGVAGISDVSNLGATKQIQVQTKTQVKIAGVADLPSAPIQRVDTSAPWVSLGDSTAPRPTMPFKIRRHEQKRAKKR